ncbi:MAG: D-ribose pyranase [Selenomonas sp.]|uniref:D-ribose pyranase n=1 Tax=Selenomonas sp. TaxID=2053611 RepID=UPI0025D5CC88|nr:D-ribose pyranase [Selenomonas sp.]MCR5758637.1 D-ribose pyranase [Selenomonas sp.]
MKKRGILHAQLSGCIAALGHKDLFMIGDAGMPIPAGVTVVDLAVCQGVPTFRQVMDAVLEEAAVEGCYLADEIREHNPELHTYIQDKLGNVEFTYMPHDALKEFSQQVRFAIRTGEFTPYPNVILRAGVVF